MKLILCRHGNTFGPDDTPVWTGSSNDLPLVEKGLEQARLMGEWLKKNNITPTTIYAGHLIRVKKFADIIHKAGYASPIRKPRGEDIMAACGQLKSATKRQKKSRAAIEAA